MSYPTVHSHEQRSGADARSAPVVDRQALMEMMALCCSLAALEDFAVWLADQFEVRS